MRKSSLKFAAVLLGICLFTWSPLIAGEIIQTQTKARQEYVGLLGQTFNGTFHVKRNGFFGEWVFALNSPRGLVRLLFYCGPEGVSAQSARNQDPLAHTIAIGVTMKQYDHYCAEPGEVPFKDGDLIHVGGTLIQPSQLSTEFIGDLYVVQIL